MSDQETNKQELPTCEFCGTIEGLSFIPDPYMSEIYHDETKVWLCYACADMRYLEV
jgi:hypothetical protein